MDVVERVPKGKRGIQIQRERKVEKERETTPKGERKATGTTTEIGREEMAEEARRSKIGPIQKNKGRTRDCGRSGFSAG